MSTGDTISGLLLSLFLGLALSAVVYWWRDWRRRRAVERAEAAQWGEWRRNRPTLTLDRTAFGASRARPLTPDAARDLAAAHRRYQQRQGERS